MIARAVLLFVLLILLPDLWLYVRWMLHKERPRWSRWLWWVPALLMLAFTVGLTCTRDFTPHPQTSLNVYLFILGVWIVPKAIYALCDGVNWLMRRCGGSNHVNWGGVLGGMLAMAAIYVVIEGSTVGFSQLEVNRVEYRSASLPDAFDGYRVAVFSDIHLGCYNDADSVILNTALDSINAWHPDAIFFIGDIQNTQPDEIHEHLWALSRLKAPDGIFSVMGNHDYAKYVGGTDQEKAANVEETKRLQRELGWRLLLNEHTLLRRGADSIYIVGLEGNEEPHCKEGYRNVKLATEGMPDETFSLMLVHNPRYWRETVLPDSKAQLTLSGHTHGGQVKIFGLSPTNIFYREDAGMYESDGRHLFVTKGLGGLIPFRYGVPGEVVLMTLHKKK